MKKRGIKNSFEMIHFHRKLPSHIAQSFSYNITLFNKTFILSCLRDDIYERSVIIKVVKLGTWNIKNMSYGDVPALLYTIT
jgi:hypothetical protein